MLGGCWGDALGCSGDSAPAEPGSAAGPRGAGGTGPAPPPLQHPVGPREAAAPPVPARARSALTCVPGWWSRAGGGRHGALLPGPAGHEPAPTARQGRDRGGGARPSLPRRFPPSLPPSLCPSVPPPSGQRWEPGACPGLPRPGLQRTHRAQRPVPCVQVFVLLALRPGNGSRRGCSCRDPAALVLSSSPSNT